MVCGLVLAGQWPVPREATLLLFAAWLIALVAYAVDRPRWLVAAVTLGVSTSSALLLQDALGDVVDAPVRSALGVLADRPRREAEPVLVEGRLVEDGSPTAFGASLLVAVTALGDQPASDRRLGTLRLSVGGERAAAATGAWRAGRLVRSPVVPRRPLPYRNPGVPDQELVLARRGIALLGSVKSAALVEVLDDGWPWQEAAGAARAWVRRRVEQSVGRWGRESAGVVTAILIGDRAGLSPETEDRLQRAGTYHVIAISGGNVAILVLLSLGAFRAAGAEPRAAALGSAVLLIAYSGVVATGASVARATVMGVGWLVARGLGLRAGPVNLVLSTVVLLTALWPLYAHDAGFALSAGATIGILVGVGPLTGSAGATASRRVPALPLPARAAVGLAAATCCAEAIVLPITAFAFSQVTFAGLVLNFVAVPAMAAIQVAGLAAVALTTCHSAVAAGTGWVAHLGVEVLVRSAGLADALPWCARRVPPPPAALVGLYYASLLAAVLRVRWRAVRIASGFAAAACLASMVAGPSARPWWAERGTRAHPARFTVTFLDVGQGDAALLQFPGGRALLLDAGGAPGPGFDVGARVVAPALWAMGTFRLTGAAITHGHPDHAGGMATVFGAFRPGWVWEGIAVEGDQLTARLRDAARRLAIAWRPAYAGATLDIGGVTLRVLHPTPPDWARRRVRNDDSLVLEARYGSASFVFMGDAGERVEAILAPAPAGVRVLKAGHHGSADATSAAWLAALRPDVIVVSAGRNNVFNHPSPAMLARCRAAGRPVLRLDAVGAVQAVTDGRRVLVSSWNGSRWVQRLEASGPP